MKRLFQETLSQDCADRSKTMRYKMSLIEQKHKDINRQKNEQKERGERKKRKDQIIYILKAISFIQITYICICLIIQYCSSKCQIKCNI